MLYQDLVVMYMYIAWYVFVNQVLLADCLTTTGSKTTHITACHGDTLTFNCSVNGGVATVWKGSAFKCMPTNNEIVLLHSRSNGSVNGTCNEGDITAYAELEVLYSNKDKYFSQINVTATFPFAVSMFTVICFCDNGTIETVVSNWTVSISSGVDSLTCGVSINITSPDDPQQDRAGIN